MTRRARGHGAQPFDACAAPLTVLASPAGEGDRENPYIRRLYSQVRSRGVLVDSFSRRRALTKYDIIHIHWPEQLIRWKDAPLWQTAGDMAKILGAIAFAKARGTKLVWTGHNLTPHDTPRPNLARLYLTVFYLMVDQVITLTDSSAHTLRRRHRALRAKPTSTIRHGHYREDYPAAISKEDARKFLDLAIAGDTPLLLAFGQVRRYKNLHLTIDAFGRNHLDAHLLVAGASDGDLRYIEKLVQSARRATHTTLRLRYLDDDEVTAAFSAADAVIMGYDDKSALNSGAALLALSFNRPLFTTESPSARELASLTERGWINVESGTHDALVRRAVQGASSRVDADDVCDLSAFGWDVIGDRTVALYYRVRGSEV